MTAFFSTFTLLIGEEAYAQEMLPAIGSPNGSPAATASSAVQTSESGKPQTTNPNSAVIELYNPSAIATVAPVSGVSGTSQTVSPSEIYNQTIGRTVNPNAFLPTDNITDSPIIVLPSMRTNGWWDLSASASTAINYDSNITRSAEGQPSFDDFYQHESAAVNFRLGTDSAPFAMQLNYNYTADLFDKYTDFDTYTHTLNFQSRIGRSNVKFFPYFTGSFRSVEDPAARDSGRETYDYLTEGLRGEEDIFPTLVHTYDFSHTSVDYDQRTGENFEIWRLYQQLDFKPFLREGHSSIPPALNNVSFYPWVELKQTAPTNGRAVQEVNGGGGASATINDQLSLNGRVGWGDVESTNPTIDNGSFSGWRYDASVDYVPVRELRMRLSYDRILSFTPSTVGRDVDVLDFVMESPLAFGSHFVLIPAIEFYHAESNDYQDPEHALFPQPSLQLTYQMNDHFAAFMKTQYRETDDTQFGQGTDVKVLQTSVGIIATF